MKSINRLIRTEFEKSKVQKLRIKLLKRYITIDYYSILYRTYIGYSNASARKLILDVNIVGTK